MRFVGIEVGYLAAIVVGVLAWVICAMYAGGIARNNGQSYNLWLVLGFLGGPITLGVAYVYFELSGERHRRMKYADRKAGNMPEIIQCPRCKQSVPSSFPTCQFCGEQLHGHRR